MGIQCKCESKDHFWIKSRGVLNIKNAEVELHYEVEP